MVVPLDFVRVPVIAVVGWLVYGEPLDALVFAGGALIVAGVMWNLRAESRGRAARLVDLDLEIVAGAPALRPREPLRAEAPAGSGRDRAPA